MKVILKFSSNIISILLSIAIYVLVIVLLIVLSIKYIFSFSTINQLVQSIDVKTIINDIDDNDDFMNRLYSNAAEINIEEKSVDLLLNSYDIKYLVSQYISGGIHYLIYNDESKVLTREVLIKSVTERLDNVLKEANINYSEEEKNRITNLILNNSKNILDSLPNVMNIVEKIDSNSLYYIRLILSTKVTLTIIGSIVLLSGIIMLLKWSLYKWLPYVGTACICSSLVCFSIGLLPMFEFSSLVKGLPDYMVNLINTSKTIISSKFIICGVICILFGTLLVVINSTIRKKEKNNINMD